MRERLLGLLLTVASLFVMGLLGVGSEWCFFGPASNEIRFLESKLENCEPKLYAALVASNKFADNADMRHIVALEDEAGSLRQRAESIWDSIRVGDLIQVNRTPVGENAEVQRLRDEAEKVEARAADARKQFTEKYAISLAGTEWSDSWDEREATVSELQRVMDQNRWYYRSPLRFILKAFGVIIFIGVLLSLAVFWFGLRIIVFGINA